MITSTFSIGPKANSALAAAPAQWGPRTREFVGGAADASSRQILEVPDVVRTVSAAVSKLPEPAQGTLVGAALVSTRPVADATDAIMQTLGAAPTEWGLREQVRLAAAAVSGSRPADEAKRIFDLATRHTPVVLPAPEKATVASMLLRSSVDLDAVPELIQRAHMSGNLLTALDGALWPNPEPPLLG